MDMAWKWPAAAKNGASEEWTGFIDQGVTLEGTLTVTGTFRIDGNVKGNIISEQMVILGDRAKVEREIEGKGVVTGEVHSPCMVIDPGGIFDGRCHMLGSSETAATVTIPIRAAGNG